MLVEVGGVRSNLVAKAACVLAVSQFRHSIGAFLCHLRYIVVLNFYLFITCTMRSLAAVRAFYCTLLSWKTLTPSTTIFNSDSTCLRKAIILKRSKIAAYSVTMRWIEKKFCSDLEVYFNAFTYRVANSLLLRLQSLGLSPQNWIISSAP